MAATFPRRLDAQVRLQRLPQQIPAICSQTGQRLASLMSPRPTDLHQNTEPPIHKAGGAAGPELITAAGWFNLLLRREQLVKQRELITGPLTSWLKVTKLIKKKKKEEVGDYRL